MTKLDYTCTCPEKKTNHLEYDGGNTLGSYTIILCPSCYQKQTKRYLVSEKLLGEIKDE